MHASVCQECLGSDQSFFRQHAEFSTNVPNVQVVLCLLAARLTSLWLEPRASRRDLVKSALSYQSRREVVQQMVPRYQEASRARKILMLDAFVAITRHLSLRDNT